MGRKKATSYDGQDGLNAIMGQRVKGRKANAQPSGGGGGVWAAHNAAAQARRDSIPKGLLYGDIANFDGAGRTITGTSIFDPVLTELCYSWFCPPGGQIIDPFAGGSVRGIVASKLGRRYFGCDLRAEQVAANEVQADEICGADDPRPVWVCGDSLDLGAHAAGVEADFLFSCPPYADLEVYSDDPRDLSTMDYPAFREAYFAIIAEAAALLKPDRFACFVVGEARGRDGLYYGFVPDTIRAFQAAGLGFYNEAVLLTAVGSLPVRAANGFTATRKLGKTHQNVLVFVKGDPRRATEACGAVETYVPGADGADPDEDGGDGEEGDRRWGEKL